jgi:hypothetical protein
MKSFFFPISKPPAGAGGMQSTMKTVLATGVACFMAATAHPQGLVNFSVGLATPVLVVAADGSPQAIPAADTFRVALYWAPDGVTDESAFTYRTSAFVAVDGIFLGGGSVELSQVGGGSSVMLQVRGWETQYGDSYEEVVASGNPAARAGKSGVFRYRTGFFPGPPAPSMAAFGFTGLTLYPVPEPTTTVLVMAGAVLFGLKGGKRGRTSINGLFGRQKPKQTSAKSVFASILD